MVIQREHEAQDIKSVMELPLTVQQQISMKTGTLDEVHNFIDENKLLDEDVFVVPFISKPYCTIGKYKNAIIKSDLEIEVDNASNSIQIANRVFTFADVTKSSDGMIHLHFFELVKDKNRRHFGCFYLTLRHKRNPNNSDRREQYQNQRNKTL